MGGSQMTQTSKAQLLGAIEELKSNIDNELDKVEALQERVEELDQENADLTSQINERDSKIQDLEDKLDGLNLKGGEIPDSLLEVIKIAYRAEPRKVSYLLNGIPAWRPLASVLETQSWLERARTES